MTPTFFALLVGAAGLLASRKAVFAVFMTCCLFGAAAAIYLPSLGGANVTPAVFFLPFLIACAVAECGVSGCLRQLAFPSAGFWLLLLIVWSILAAFFLPRIFAGEILITTVNRDADYSGVSLIALRPVSGNLTQVGYAIGGVCVFMAVRALLQLKDGSRQFRDAVLLLAALNCLAAAINLAELYAGLPQVLDYVRNGNYANVTGEEVRGLGRIAGTFPEASAFAAFTLPLFAFTSSLWMSGRRSVLSGSLAAASLVLLLLSTSTTAYVGLFVYLSCASIVLAVGTLLRGTVPRAGRLAAASLVVLLAVTGVLVLAPAIADPIVEFFDTIVFNKLQSSSGVERSAWNGRAWSNFVETYGAGVGLGSARASSYPLVLLSNVGAVGTLLFLGFVLQLCSWQRPRGAESDEAAVRAAARQAVAAALISASLSAVVFDLGVTFYALAAAAAAPSVWQRSAKGERASHA